MVAPSFEDSEVFDFYDIRPDGGLERIAQTRPCLCWGPDQAEAISRRGVEAIIVRGISPNTFLKFMTSGVKVFMAEDRSISVLLDLIAAGRLKEMDYREFAKLGKTKKERIS